MPDSRSTPATPLLPPSAAQSRSICRPPRRREAITSAALSAVLPGFGQLRNGQVDRAIWLFTGFVLLTVPVLAAVAVRLPDRWTLPALLLTVLASLSVWAFGVVDAWRGARLGGAGARRPWQTPAVFVLVVLVCNGLVLPAAFDYVRTYQVESFRIPSASMAPAILPGDVLFADKRYNCPGCATAVRRGDVAIFVYPNDRTRYYIKRIVGLPGDRVALDGRSWQVEPAPERLDGQPAPTRTAGDEGAAPAATRMTVPAGHVFVTGDNRDASVDSRDFGAIPLQDVVGRARQIWFSSDHGSPRWERLGQVVR